MVLGLHSTTEHTEHADTEPEGQSFPVAPVSSVVTSPVT
jgi:hypothetical protein